MTPSRVTDPAVLAASSALDSTFRRMEAIEGRHAASILTTQEADHEHVLGQQSNRHLFSAAGCASVDKPAAPFNAQAAHVLEKLRTGDTSGRPSATIDDDESERMVGAARE